MFLLWIQYHIPQLHLKMMWQIISACILVALLLEAWQKLLLRQHLEYYEAFKSSLRRAALWQNVLTSESRFEPYSNILEKRTCMSLCKRAVEVYSV